MTRDIFLLAKRKSKLSILLHRLLFCGKLSVKYFDAEVEKMKSRVIDPMSLDNRKKVVTSIYAEVDSEIERQSQVRKVKPICEAKCHDCCSDYFYVSQSELCVILDYIKQNNIDLDGIVAKSHQYRQQLLNDYPDEHLKLSKKRNAISFDEIGNLYNDNDVQDGKYPCPLLGDGGECIVYPVRTLICRYFGFDINHTGCSKITKKTSKGVFKKQIDEKKLSESTYQLKPIEDYLCTIDHAIHLGRTQLFAVAPLFWWFDINNEVEHETRNKDED